MDMNGIILVIFFMEIGFGRLFELIELKDGNILYIDMENKKKKISKKFVENG